MKTLGEKFKILRQKKGVTQKAMADLLKISIPAYSKLETDITDPNFSRINQIAGLHDITFRELFEVGEDPQGGQTEVIAGLNAKVNDLESTIIRLQSKIIELYDRESIRNGN